MVTLSEMIILTWWLLIHRFTISVWFLSPEMMTKQKGYVYQRIWAIEAFEDENTRIDVKCYNYYENKNMSDYRTQGAISNKVNPVTNVFTDEPEIQCDVQVVENTLVNDSK